VINTQPQAPSAARVAFTLSVLQLDDAGATRASIVLLVRSNREGGNVRHAAPAQSIRWYVRARSDSHGPPFREYSPRPTIVCPSAEIVPTNRCEKSAASRHHRHSLASRRVS